VQPVNFDDLLPVEMPIEIIEAPEPASDFAPPRFTPRGHAPREFALRGYEPQYGSHEPYYESHDSHSGRCAACGCGRRGCLPGRLWLRGEYLVWWVDGFSTPPLVTTSPDGTARDAAGVLGEPTTAIIFGGTDLVDSARSGGRISLGYWFDPCETCGVELSYFGLAQDESTFRRTSPGDPILARPFFNLEPGFEGQDAELIAFPDLFEGNIAVRSESTLQGFELLFRRAACRSCGYRIDWLVGWRYSRLDDELTISDFRRVLSGDTGLAIGTTLSEFDRFETQNTFNGVELGVAAAIRRCRWSLELAMKLALGNNHSRVAINGQTTSSTPVPGGPPVENTTASGLLAQQSNIGVYSSDQFAVIPELDLKLGWHLTPCLRATFGYTFMYWCHVARPGDQIDLDLNLSQLTPGGLVGVPRPRFLNRFTDVWAQGFSFGLDYRF
jgi:hypothetical protein